MCLGHKRVVLFQRAAVFKLVIQLNCFALFVEELFCFLCNTGGFLEYLISLGKLEIKVVKLAQLQLRYIAKPDNLLLRLFSFVDDAHPFFIFSAIIDQSLQRFVVHELLAICITNVYALGSVCTVA